MESSERDLWQGGLADGADSEQREREEEEAGAGGERARSCRESKARRAGVATAAAEVLSLGLGARSYQTDKFASPILCNSLSPRLSPPRIYAVPLCLFMHPSRRLSALARFIPRTNSPSEGL
ncbi:hypothetical protein FKP32DRAFT_447643 [Trametes sanguinea]|nr:hypothetical protein FKP32DRAFT_447643 [Trametes sanguinea]